jgi:hypothetical protein
MGGFPSWDTEKLERQELIMNENDVKTTLVHGENVSPRRVTVQLVNGKTLTGDVNVGRNEKNKDNWLPAEV